MNPVTGQLDASIKKTRYTHEAMADLILANPAISQNELAAYFGYSPGWVSTVITSDAFQAFLAEKKERIVDPVLRGAVEESFKGLVLRSIEILRKKLDGDVDGGFALEVMKHSSKALGYGARVQVSGNITHSHSLMHVLESLPPPAPKEIDITPAMVEGERAAA